MKILRFNGKGRQHNTSSSHGNSSYEQYVEMCIQISKNRTNIRFRSGTHIFSNNHSSSDEIHIQPDIG